MIKPLKNHSIVLIVEIIHRGSYLHFIFALPTFHTVCRLIIWVNACIRRVELSADVVLCKPFLLSCRLKELAISTRCLGKNLTVLGHRPYKTSLVSAVSRVKCHETIISVICYIILLADASQRFLTGIRVALVDCLKRSVVLLLAFDSKPSIVALDAACHEDDYQRDCDYEDKSEQ